MNRKPIATILTVIICAVALLAGSADTKGAMPGAPEPWGRPIWVVHGGGEGDGPENTLAALKKSATLGAKYAEIDLRVTKDGQVVVIHDKTINRTTNGKGRVSELTYAQIRRYDAGSWFGPEFKAERVPLLSEALRFARTHDMKLLLHIKEPAVCPLLYDLLEKQNMVNNARVYMKAADAKVRKALDRRVGQYRGSLVQPWGYKKGPKIVLDALKDKTKGGALVRSYFSVIQAFPDINNKLLNWGLWEKYRSTVVHPATTIKRADLLRARQNIARYGWARKYAQGLENGVKPYLTRLTPAFLKQMVPATTPQHSTMTGCPACRDLKKPYHPAGQWRWSPRRPEELKCVLCGTVFPNKKYPETVVLKTRFGGGQTLTFYGGKPMNLFGYASRPTFTGNIRARKANFMKSLCRRMAETYALTGKTEYAIATKAILLRFAEVYPNWLVHSGYGEYADMNPHIAAQCVNYLPEPELVYPPNKPNRKLHRGYWAAGRAQGSGMEGYFIWPLAEAYDLTCTAKSADGKAIFNDKEKRKIERDLLLEGTVLLVSDKGLNNKSVGNRTAVGLVGMCVGHPQLVRFGLEGFMRTVDDWFLPDGGTSESPVYACMTLRGIDASGQAFRNYTDPAGYRPKGGAEKAGGRLENFNPYHDTAYNRVWQAMFNGMLGNRRYPPYADSYVWVSLSSRFVELMAANYPENLQYLALLKEVAGADLGKGKHSTAIYYREPGLEQKKSPPLSLPDVLFPSLRLGYLRTGADGRESALVLSASHWGIHHHRDSLNLYYWKDGCELLSDLGYLWDHPMKNMTARTFAHNLVVIDEKEQTRTKRGGEFHLFHVSPQVKVMEASSAAYSQARLYRRTCALVPSQSSKLASYVVDIFRVQGGSKQDYLFHGINNACTIKGLNLGSAGKFRKSISGASSAYGLRNVKAGDGGVVWKAVWRVNKKMRFAATSVGEPGETALIGDGWGQRNFRNKDIGVTIPYIVRRRTEANDVVAFTTVFEGYKGNQPFVQQVRRLKIPPAEKGNTVALEVRTAEGTDYVISCLKARPTIVETPAGKIEFKGRFGFIRVRKGMVLSAALAEGTMLRLNGRDCKAKRLEPARRQ